MRHPVLPVDLLDDGRIECGDYDDWAQACFRIKSYPDDRAKLDDLLATIPQRGLDEPLWLEISNHSHRIYLTDGHHRAVALMELGVREFPYRWRWRFPRWRGERLPVVRPGEPLPETVLHRLLEGS